MPAPVNEAPAPHGYVDAPKGKIHSQTHARLSDWLVICFAFQGPTTVRDLVQPQELLFHLDEKIITAIAAADKRYQQTV